MNAINSTISDEADDSAAISLHLVIILAFPAVVIIFLTVIGNLLVLRFKARVGRTNTTLLVWNLGLTDFLVGVIVQPLAAVHLFKRKWIFGRLLCRIWVAADVTFCTCSVVTICVISVDRYLSVTRPLQYKSIVTKYKVITVIILIWAFSTSILITTVRWEQTNQINQNECFAGNEIRYLTHSVVFAFFLPALVTLTLYWRIYKLARNRQRALDRGFLMILGHNMNFLTNTLSQTTALRVHVGPNNGMVEHQRRVLRTHERIAKTLGVVSCSFLFCWLPFFLLYLTNYACRNCLPTFIIDIASWLGYCNSMLNPIIYSFTVKEFKRSTLRMILPLWIFLHNLCPDAVRKPSEHSCKTITRNVMSKNRNRKNRINQPCNANRMAAARKRVVHDKTSNTKIQHTTSAVYERSYAKSSRFGRDSNHHTTSLTMGKDFGNTYGRKPTVSARKISEPTHRFALPQLIAKSKSADRYLLSLSEDMNNTATSFVEAETNSASQSTCTSISSSSESLETMVMRMPYKVKYPKRHSLPAVSPLTPANYGANCNRRGTIQIAHGKFFERVSSVFRHSGRRKEINPKYNESDHRVADTDPGNFGDDSDQARQGQIYQVSVILKDDNEQSKTKQIARLHASPNKKAEQMTNRRQSPMKSNANGTTNLTKGIQDDHENMSSRQKVIDTISNTIFCTTSEVDL